MSSEWSILKIEDIAERVGMGPFGSSIKVETFVESGIPIISGEHLHDITLTEKKFRFITEQHATQLVKSNVFRGDVVFTHAGTIGQVSVIPEDSKYVKYILSQRQFFMRCNKELVNPLYVAYFFKSPQGRHKLLANASQVGVPSIARPVTYLRSIEIPVPPLAIQNQIVSVIESMRDRITLLRETNATLEAIAQALFKSWFVDFDPVRAKSEGKLPEGMDEATASLFPDSFEQSELGEIPKGWQIGKVIDLGEVICGKTPPTSNINNYGDEVPFITIPDMHGVLTITTTTRSLSKLGADSQNKKYLRKGAVCVSCIATAGLVASVTTSSQTNQQINSVVPSVLWGDAFTLLLLRRIGEVVRSEGSGGSVFHNLNKSNFKLIKVLLPTSKLAISFDQMISPLIEKITENQLQIKILSDLRDTLLPRLISGQIRLSDEEEINSKIKVDA